MHHPPHPSDHDGDDDDDEEVEVAEDREHDDEEAEDAGLETRDSGAAGEPRPWDDRARSAWRCARWSTVPWCPRG